MRPSTELHIPRAFNSRSISGLHSPSKISPNPEGEETVGTRSICESSVETCSTSNNTENVTNPSVNTINCSGYLLICSACILIVSFFTISIVVLDELGYISDSQIDSHNVGDDGNNYTSLFFNDHYEDVEIEANDTNDDDEVCEYVGDDFMHCVSFSSCTHGGCSCEYAIQKFNGHTEVDRYYCDSCLVCDNGMFELDCRNLLGMERGLIGCKAGGYDHWIAQSFDIQVDLDYMLDSSITPSSLPPTLFPTKLTEETDDAVNFSLKTGDVCVLGSAEESCPMINIDGVDMQVVCALETSATDAITICCRSGVSHTIVDGTLYCTGIPFGSPCLNNEMCDSNKCDRGGITEEQNNVSKRGGFCALKDVGEMCTHDHECGGGICAKMYGSLFSTNRICCPNESSVIMDAYCGGLSLGSICDNNDFCSGNSVCINKECSENEEKLPVVLPSMVAPGEECEQNDQCEQNACALESAEIRSPTVCCLSGKFISYLTESYCTEMIEGSKCKNNDMCAGDLICKFQECKQSKKNR